jgi:hypothetical protein
VRGLGAAGLRLGGESARAGDSVQRATRRAGAEAGGEGAGEGLTLQT